MLSFYTGSSSSVSCLIKWQDKEPHTERLEMVRAKIIHAILNVRSTLMDWLFSNNGRPLPSSNFMYMYYELTQRF